MSMQPRELVNRFRTLEAERRNLDNRWQVIGHYVVPGRGRFFEKESDYEESINWRRRELFDSTAINACQTLASNIHGNLTTPSARWFTLRFRGSSLNDNHEAMQWLEKCQEMVWYALQESNFNLEVNENYLDLCSYGTAILLHEVDDDGTFKFRAAMAREIYFEEDFSGMPVGIYRMKKYTALQVYEKFEATCPENIKTEALGADTANNPYEVLHVIRLRPENMDADVNQVLAPEARPYEERYVLIRDGHELTLEPSGYYEMPAYVMRWGRAAGSKFGYSPAINVLADILTLNQLVELILKSAEKALDPPTLTQQRGIIGDLDIKPAGVTVVRDINGIKPYISGAQFDVSQLQREHLVRTIRQAFYVDQLELKESPAMTATEVNVRYELMQRLLGPALARLQNDFMDPLIKRSFYSLARLGMLPEMPPQVAELQAELEIEYLGPLARSQKLNDVMAGERLMASLGQIAAVAPEVLDTIDWDKWVRITADRLGVPAELLRTEDAVEEIRAAREQAAQQAQEMAMAESLTKSMKQGAEADKAASQANVVPMP